jgi:hypothetical protein
MSVQRQASFREPISRELPSVRERTRADNRDRYLRSPEGRSAREFRCECARPDCIVRLPLEVERHRRGRDRFIVGLAHLYDDTLVGVADGFLVVEAKGITQSPPAARNESRATLIFFTSESSGPARRMEGLLAHVALKEQDRLRVRHVDVAKHAHLVRTFGVERVPCLVLVVDRKVAGRIDGRANRTQIEVLLERHLAGTAV